MSGTLQRGRKVFPLLTGPRQRSGSASYRGSRLGVRYPNRGTVKNALVALHVVLAFGGTACSTTEPEPDSITLLPAEFIAAVDVPLSVNLSVTLVDSTTACVVDSYELRIVCVGSDGSTVGAFGREGEGPGEFEGPLALMRGAAGTLGAFDVTRLTVFEPDGNILRSAPAPFLFAPMAPLTQSVTGSYSVRVDDGYRTFVSELDAESGEELWERAMLHPSELGMPLECERGYTTGALGPGGRMAFATCQSDLVLWDGDDVVTFRDPTYASELPSETDIETHRERWRLAFGFPATESQMLVYAETPKWVTITGRSLIYDDWGRLWVAIQRDRHAFSYFSIFADTTYVGSVRVRDRIEGYDLLGSTLAVLVERLPDDPTGIPGRGVDWYRFEPPGRN